MGAMTSFRGARRRAGHGAGRWIAAGAALLSALASGCTYTVSERDLFLPRRFPLPPAQVAVRDVELRAADGTLLRGRRVAVAEPSRALLYFYGNGETVLEVTPLLAGLAERHRAAVLALDYRGYGFSEGSPSLAGIAADAPAVFDLLSAEGLPVVVYGRSLGTAFALRAALERPAAGLILEAPPTAVTDVIAAWQRNVPWYLRPFVRLRPDKALRRLGPQPQDEIARLEAPLLVVHGTADRSIPIALGRRMLERAGSAVKSLCAVEGAGHNGVDVLRGPAAVCIGRFLEDAARPSENGGRGGGRGGS